MTRRLRVLHVIQNLNYGGMERLFSDIVRLLDQARFESHVLIMHYLGRFGEGLEKHATIHFAGQQPRWSLLWPGGLIRQIRRIAPDVVHSHGGVWYKISLAARRAGVPRVIHTEHGRQVPDPPIDRLVGWLASRRTDVTVAVSEALQGYLARKVVADPSRLRLILNGVDTRLYHPGPDDGELRRSLEVPPGAPVIGSIGRLERIKGYDIMIEAFALLRQEIGSGEMPFLVVGGEGSERPALEARVRELGLASWVRLPGWRDDIHSLHASFTIFTMSSRSEGTSVSLLEAMSAGLPPVVTDVGGNRLVLGERLAGNLVATQRPDLLARSWLELLAAPERREADAAEARRRVIEVYSLEQMVQSYERLYAGDS